MNKAAAAHKLFDQKYYASAVDAALAARQEPRTDKDDLLLLIVKALENMKQYLPALGYANRLLQQSPDHAQGLAHRGVVLLRLSQLQDGKADLASAVELDPEYAYAWENLFYAAYDTNDEPLCERALENLERLGAERGFVYRLRGTRRLKTGDQAGGEADLRRACAHERGDASAAVELKQAGFELRTGDEQAMFGIRYAQNNPPLAIDNMIQGLAKGLAYPKREAKVVERLGQLLKAQGRDAEAVQHATQLTERHPDRPDAWLTRAGIDAQTSSYKQAWKLSPQEATPAYARHLLASGQTQAAVEACEARVQAEPHDAETLAAMGDALMALGQDERAKEAWLAAEALGDGKAATARRAAFGAERGMDHFDAALNHVDRRATDEAVAEFERAIEKFRSEIRVPGDQPHRYLAKSLYNSAFLRELKVDDAILEPYFLEAIELDPSYADAMLAMGNLALRTHRVPDGLEWFARAGKANPSAGQPWFYRARHFSEQGDHAQAIDDATKAFNAYSRRGQARFAADAVMIRGKSHEALGKLQDAMADYDLAHDYGHPTGFAMGDHIRERIAIEDGGSDEAQALLDKTIERIADGECPWAQIDFLESRVKGSERAQALVAKLKQDGLADDETSWLVEFLKDNR